jgi:hypothetical protein
MTVKTNAERLRLMMAEEDENAPVPANAGDFIPGTFAAMRVFLEAAHQHQSQGFAKGCRCWICLVVKEMIRAFGEATG